MERFNRGETASLKFEMYDRMSNQLVDCDDGYPTITITDAEDTARVTTTEMERLSTGVYYYNYSIGAAYPAGWHNIDVIGVATTANGICRERERWAIKVV